MKLFSLLAVLLLAACNQPPENIKTDRDQYTIYLTFYDTQAEVNKVCGTKDGGCWKDYGNGSSMVFTVRSRCMLDHEIDHVLYGDFHKPGAACTERAN